MHCLDGDDTIRLENQVGWELNVTRQRNLTTIFLKLSRYVVKHIVSSYKQVSANIEQCQWSK